MLLLSLFLGCPQDKPATDKAGDTAAELEPDSDGDGVPDSADCDPDNPYVYPGYYEIPYNGVDDDCDGIIVNDVDGDGYDGVRGGGDDCDDNNPNINPGHVEVCYDGLDNNCDGWEGGTDCDGDGYPLGRDCWDDEEDTSFPNPGGLRPADVYPGAPDVWYDGTDADCALNDDYDQDGDGEASAAYTGTDCDDLDPRVNTGMDELWNGFDDDCDGTTDTMVPGEAWMRVSGSSGDGEAGFGTAIAFVPDLDGDGTDDLVVGMSESDEYVGGAWILPSEPGILTPVAEALGSLSGTGGTGAALVRTGITGTETLAVASPWGESSGAVDFYDLGSIADGAAVARIEHEAAGGELFAMADGRLAVGCTLGAASLTVSTWEAVRGTMQIGDAAFSLSTTSLLCSTTADLGDLDGDGLNELLIAGYDEDGDNHVYMADGVTQSIGGSVPTVALTDLGNASLDLRWSFLPDLDGDGYDEAMITDPTYDAASTGDGRIWIVDGDTFVPAWTGAASATLSGGISGAAIRPGTLGDVDGDGVTDLLVGATGQAELYFVSTTDLLAGGDHVPVSRTPSFADTASATQFGDESWAYDFDRDGDVDVLVRTGRTPGGLYLFRHE
jgi:hypothetical protein